MITSKHQSLLFAILLTFGCSTVPPPPLSAGELHNNGVLYILRHFGNRPIRELTPSRIADLTQSYCKETGIRCAFSTPVPSFPLDVDRSIANSTGSDAFKSRLRALSTAVRSARNIPELEATTAVLEKNAKETLNAAEMEHFANVVSIATASARLWAPISAGGRNGGGATLPGGTAKIDWHEVALADAIGCWLSVEAGCLAGAVAFSTADLVWQLANGA